MHMHTHCCGSLGLHSPHRVQGAGFVSADASRRAPIFSGALGERAVVCSQLASPIVGEFTNSVVAVFAETAVFVSRAPFAPAPAKGHRACAWGGATLQGWRAAVAFASRVIAWFHACSRSPLVALLLLMGGVPLGALGETTISSQGSATGGQAHMESSVVGQPIP